MYTKEFTVEQEQIEQVMSLFDFNRVEKVMRFLNWHWWDAENGVPTLSEIKTHARVLMERLNRETDMKGISTGGFEAFRTYDEFGYTGIGLRFTIARTL